MWPGVGENFFTCQPPQDNSVSSGVVWVTGLFSLCLEFNFKHGTRWEHVSHIHYIVLGNAQPSLTSRNTKVAKTPAFHFITLSHPGLTGGDLDAFVPVCLVPLAPPLLLSLTADFRSPNNFWKTFHGTFVFSRINGADVGFGHYIDLEFSRSNFQLTISEEKNQPIDIKKSNISVDF